MEAEILEEIKKTNRLLEKLIGFLQSMGEDDPSYHEEIAKDGRVRIPKEAAIGSFHSLPGEVLPGRNIT